MADLSKFNLRTANEVYKVEKEESLEAILLALHLPADQVAMDVTDLHPQLDSPGEDGPESQGGFSLQGGGGLPGPVVVGGPAHH